VVISFFLTRKINLNLPLLPITLFLSYLIYVGYKFYNNAIPFIVESFRNFDMLANRLTAGEMGRSQSLERELGIIVTLLPLLICILISILAISRLVLNKGYKHNAFAFMISYFGGCLLLFLIPYGGDINVGRTAYFVNIGSAFFVSCLTKKYIKILSVLIMIFILIHPIGYSGGGTKTSVIPISELAGTKFFANTTRDNIYYFSQASSSIIWYQNPSKAFKQKYYTLWYPPSGKFNVSTNFDYILYSIRDHSGLIYYLGYDPISQKMDELNNLFMRVYDSQNFQLYYRYHKSYD